MIEKFKCNTEEFEVYWKENYFGYKFVTLRNCTKDEVMLINTTKNKDIAEQECQKLKKMLKFLGAKEITYDFKRKTRRVDLQ